MREVYEVFASGEDCIGYAIGVAVDELFVAVDEQAGDGAWAVEVEEAIAGFYGACAANPMLAELFLIHAAASRVEHGRAAALAGAERFVALLGRGRAEAEQRGLRVAAPLADEFFSRAVVAVAAQRVRAPVMAELPDQSRAIAMTIVGFYLDPEAAEQALGT
jgi:hypothetical protein